MAQVYGPLHSQSASGQFAGTLIYQPYKGKTYVRAYGKPDWLAHPPTELQLNVQATTKVLMEAWPALSDADKATWDALAIPRRISRINAYLQENYRLGFSGQDLTTVYPAIEYPYQYGAAGATTPATEGTYNRMGGLWAYQPYYYCEATDKTLFWNVSNSAWIIATSAAVNPVKGFRRIAATIPGTYTAYGVGYTGSPVLVQN